MAAFLNPGRMARLAGYRLRRRWCPTLAWILSHGQRVPPQLDRWIDDVRRVHHNAESWLDLAATGEPTGTAKGLFIVIAGPDGVGKSTLRNDLTNVLRRHHPVWSGRLSGPLSELRRGKRQGESLSGPPVSGGALSTVRVLYLFGDALLRWLMWTRSWLKRGGWVITERGWWDIAVYPSRYRVEPVGRLHRALGMLSPRPDLILVMEAAAAEIRARKDELSEGEIRHQTDLWRSAIPRRQPHVYMDASVSSEVLLNRALDVIELTYATQVLEPRR
jgi:thymidylate kinase